MERWIIAFMEHCQIVRKKFDSKFEAEDWAASLARLGYTVNVWREVTA